MISTSPIFTKLTINKSIVVDITSIEFFVQDENLESACKICFMLSSEVRPSLHRFRRKSLLF
jgi:hypothetical protein